MKRALVIILAVTAVLSTAFVASPSSRDSEIDVDVEFVRTFNLFPNSPVRVRGIDVGVITALKTDPSRDVVTVSMRLDEGLSLPADVNAVIITSALLGERYIQLAGGTLGDRLGDGDVIPAARTIVPFEFDEVLEGLNDFVGGLDENEVARLVTNLANLLDGQGQQLGSTLDAASGAIAALKDNDEELIDLARAVSDLNETLVTRDQELAALLRDFVRVTDTLTAESTDLDGALDGLLVLTRELAELLIDHRADLSDDLDTLTRVGRTANRNLDQISVAILGSAELFRHADRVVDRETNMLPLVNHAGALAEEIETSLDNRFTGLCLAGGGTVEECESIDLSGVMSASDGGLCLPGLIECTSSTTTVAELIVEAVRQHPAIGDELVRRRDVRTAQAGTTDASEPRWIEEAHVELALIDDAQKGNS
jgi:phospholipid/cholesterol/gamma-HCH transport system substrate-binding protein